MSLANPKDRAVLFIDLLGFAKLTELNTLDFDALRRRQHILISLGDSVARPRNPLTDTFAHFHYTLKWAIELAQMSHPLTAITFSDSAFIVTSTLPRCIAVAVHMVQSLLQSEIPARAAIAWGSFATIRLKSDIIGEWGEHSAHFLGTGIVFSTAAEKCGIKGIRILLHPTAAARVIDAPTSQQILVPCSPVEQSNSIGVQYEIDYWSFKPTAEVGAWRSLQNMWLAAPASEVTHYEATAQAINRMRVAQGEEPLSNLRRRTLPRRAHTLRGA